MHTLLGLGITELDFDRIMLLTGFFLGALFGWTIRSMDRFQRRKP